MNYRYAIGALAAMVLAVTSTGAGNGLKSGPQVGEEIPGPFEPMNITGEMAGKKHCLVWENGDNPVAMIFAREISGPLTSLVKKIDAETAKHSAKEMGSFIVFLSDKKNLDQDLKQLATKEGLKQIVLTIDDPTGPEGYNVAKGADITIVLYNKYKVEVNHAFREGELTDQAIEKVVKDISKIIK